MPPQTTASDLSRSVKPICPRDNHVMHYEGTGISWQECGEAQAIPSYHCGYFGCSVRYTHTDGYFTVVDTPDLPHFVEEPGTNLLQCPRHGTYLYRGAVSDKDGGFEWRCGVHGCDYVHADIESAWYRPQ